MAVQWGMKRGVCSNEAGLGSSVMVHSSSNVREPVVQGMWGIFEVFADTIIVCTITAFAVLSSGLVDLDTGEVLSMQMIQPLLLLRLFQLYSEKPDPALSQLQSCSLHFSTVLGWSQYGSKALSTSSVQRQLRFIRSYSFSSSLSVQRWILPLHGISPIPSTD